MRNPVLLASAAALALTVTPALASPKAGGSASTDARVELAQAQPSTTAADPSTSGTTTQQAPSDSSGTSTTDTTADPSATDASQSSGSADEADKDEKADQSAQPTPQR